MSMSADAGSGSLRLLTADAAVRAALGAFEGSGSPFQALPFVAAFADHRLRLRRGRFVLLVYERGGRVEAVLPLAIERRGPFRVAVGVGETHANTLAWRLGPGALPPRLTPGALDRAAKEAGARIDAIVLRRIAAPALLLGEGFACRPSPERRTAITLDGGLPGVLSRGNGKRKRKRFKAQGRFFAERGGYRFRALSPTEQSAGMDTFLAQKAGRLRMLGRPNPFAEPGIADFVRALFDGREPGAQVFVIEAEGETKALLAGLADGDTFWAMVISIAMDEDIAVSPGELMLWHTVEHASRAGFRHLDLGPGEERYKTSWCDRIETQTDAFAPLTAAGRTFVSASLAVAALERLVKGSPRVRNGVQRLRMLLQRRNAPLQGK